MKRQNRWYGQTMSSRLVLIYLSLAIVLVITAAAFDNMKVVHGTWDKCRKIRIGETKFSIGMKARIYEHTHGGWHINSPCDEGTTYYLRWSRPILLKRLDTLEIVKYFDENISSERMIVSDLVGHYGLEIDSTMFSVSRDTSYNIFSTNGSIVLKHSHYRLKKDIVTIFILD